MKFFLSFFCCLLSVVSICSFPIAVFADDADEGDNTSFTIDFVNTVPTDHISDVVAEWLDVDNTNFTYADLAVRFADAYISYQFAAPSGVASTLKEALKSVLWNYAFSVDSRSGFVVAEPEFYHELDAIYSRFGFDSGPSMIGEWVSLPVTYWQNFNGTISPGGTAYDYRSDFAVYTTYLISGGRVSTHLFAIRSNSSATAQERVHYYNETFGSWLTFNVLTPYTGSVYSGFYGARGSGRYLVGSNGYSSQSDALRDFFGDAEEHGGHVWNGDLYYDERPHAFTLNNLPNGMGIAENRYNDLVEDNKTPDDDITPYFNGNDTIIYRPVFEDIPNTHDFSFELPSGTMPDLDFDFNYTLVPDNNGIMTPFDEPFTYGFFAVALLALGVFLLIEVMT